MGNVADFRAAADLILRKENDPLSALFLSCYVDPDSDFGGKDAAEMLSGSNIARISRFARLRAKASTTTLPVRAAEQAAEFVISATWID